MIDLWRTDIGPFPEMHATALEPVPAGNQISTIGAH